MSGGNMADVDWERITTKSADHKESTLDWDASFGFAVAELLTTRIQDDIEWAEALCDPRGWGDEPE